MDDHGLITRALPGLTMDDSLADVLDTLRTVREWSCDLDEQVRAHGGEPESITIGMPVAQVDAILVILDRAQAEHRRSARACRRWIWIAWASAAVNVAVSLVHLVLILRGQ
jgi:hypothetical protein